MSALAEANTQRRNEARQRLAQALQADSVDKAMQMYGTTRRTTMTRAVLTHPEFREAWTELSKRSRKPHQVTEKRLRQRQAAREAAAQRLADLVEDAEFLARHGATHYEATRRLGHNQWPTVRGELKRAGRGDVAERLVANTHSRYTDDEVQAGLFKDGKVAS